MNCSIKKIYLFIIINIVMTVSENNYFYHARKADYKYMFANFSVYVPIVEWVYSGFWKSVTRYEFNLRKSLWGWSRFWCWNFQVYRHLCIVWYIKPVVILLRHRLLVQTFLQNKTTSVRIVSELPTSCLQPVFY